MTRTQITTAARRIARDLNVTPAVLVSYYGADGRCLGSHEAGMSRADGKPFVDDILIKMVGRRGAATRATYREIQNWLDAEHATSHIADPSQREFERNLYLNSLEED